LRNELAFAVLIQAVENYKLLAERFALSGFPQTPVGKKRLSKSVIKGLVQIAKKWGANPEEWISMMKGG